MTFDADGELLKFAGAEAGSWIRDETAAGTSIKGAIAKAFASGTYGAMYANAVEHQLAALTRRVDALPAGTVQPFDDARIKALEARLEAVESARYMRFLGPHDPGVSYGCGAVTLRSGSAWVALTPTTATPGSSSDWRRLGKDATE